MLSPTETSRPWFSCTAVSWTTPAGGFLLAVRRARPAQSTWGQYRCRDPVRHLAVGGLGCASGRRNSLTYVDGELAQTLGEDKAKGAEASSHRKPENRPASREDAEGSATGEARPIRCVGDGSCPEPGRRVIAAEEAGGEDQVAYAEEAAEVRALTHAETLRGSCRSCEQRQPDAEAHEADAPHHLVLVHVLLLHSKALYPSNF